MRPDDEEKVAGHTVSALVHSLDPLPVGTLPRRSGAIVLVRDGLASASTSGGAQRLAALFVAQVQIVCALPTDEEAVVVLALTDSKHPSRVLNHRLDNFVLQVRLLRSGER